MPNTISWMLHLNVREGQLDILHALMPEMVASTQEETGTPMTPRELDNFLLRYPKGRNGDAR